MRLTGALTRNTRKTVKYLRRASQYRVEDFVAIIRKLARLLIRVKHIETYDRLVSAITSKILRISMEHIDSICSLESELSLYYLLEFTIFGSYR